MGSANSPMGYANPDAVTQIANGLSTTTYAYDNNGNLTSAGTGTATTTYTYDYANRLIALFACGATTTYGYDAFGQRVLQTIPTDIHDQTDTSGPSDDLFNALKKIGNGQGIRHNKNASPVFLFSRVTFG
jgi:YD repeat-containing protein